MKKLTVNKNDAGQRLDKFLFKFFGSIPSSIIYKGIRKKRIKVNGKKSEISYMLCEGDVLELYINDEFFESEQKDDEFKSVSSKLSVVYEDENILLVDKNQGLLEHPDKNEYRDTLISRICHYLYKKGEYNPAEENSFSPALANRIDRNTGGIVIAAKNAAALKILCDKIKTRELDKRYLAIVHGRLKKKEGLLEGYLFKDETKNQVFLENKKTDSNKTVKTKYKVLAEKNDLSLVEVELITGRTHQIRAHFASIGHPLLGDGKYGKLKEDKKLGFSKQALYSYKLTFKFTEDADILNYLNSKTFSVNSVWFAEQLFGFDNL